MSATAKRADPAGAIAEAVAGHQATVFLFLLLLLLLMVVVVVQLNCARVIMFERSNAAESSQPVSVHQP